MDEWIYTFFHKKVLNLIKKILKINSSDFFHAQFASSGLRTSKCIIIHTLTNIDTHAHIHTYTHTLTFTSISLYYIDSKYNRDVTNDVTTTWHKTVVHTL